MNIAVIGSRSLSHIDITRYIPANVSCIISGGAMGVDLLASQYAKTHNIPILEFFPNYKKFGRAATFIRNREIITAADIVIALWDGRSKGTEYTIKQAQKANKKVIVHLI